MPEIILFDEPTSALDPTMVGEVQAVIRDLAGTGRTLMIVTHEMNFARSISNRVFYMDESGICEDGTPEQIFDNPQKEKTRRFIRKLKALELNIKSRDYDFLAMESEIGKYCVKNRIPWKTAHHMHLAFEELIQQLLIPVLEKPEIRTVFEYSEAGEWVEMSVGYRGPSLDATLRGDELSLNVLKSTMPEKTYTFDQNAEYPNLLLFRWHF